MAHSALAQKYQAHQGPVAAGRHRYSCIEQVKLLTRFSNRQIFLVHPDVNQRSQLLKKLVLDYGTHANIAWIKQVKLGGAIQCRCRIVEQWVGHALFDPEKPLDRVLPELLKTNQQYFLFVEDISVLPEKMLAEFERLMAMPGLSLSMILGSSRLVQTGLKPNQISMPLKSWEEPEMADEPASSESATGSESTPKSNTRALTLGIASLMLTGAFWLAKPVIFGTTNDTQVARYQADVMVSSGVTADAIARVKPQQIPAKPGLKANTATAPAKPGPNANTATAPAKPGPKANTATAPAKPGSKANAAIAPAKPAVAKPLATSDKRPVFTGNAAVQTKIAPVAVPVVADVNVPTVKTQSTAEKPVFAKPIKVEAPKPLVKAKPVASVEKVAGMELSNAYFAEAKPAGYVLQLAGIGNAASLNKFVAARALPEGAKVYKANWGKTHRFVIVLDGFASYADAKSGLSALPEVWRNSGAWIKSLKSVKKELTKS